MADGIDKDRLVNIVDRLERLGGEVEGIKGDMKDLLAEAKGQGFEPKLIRKCIALKKLDSEKRRAEEAELEVYKNALGID